MKIEHLQYFVTLTTMPSPSINGAAEKLFISQQQLNRIISALEEEVNCKLLERSTKGITLTDDGIVFLEHANIILNEYTIMKNRLLLRQNQTITNTVSENSVVKIMVTPPLFIYSVELIKRLKSIAPNISLKIEEFNEYSIQHLDNALYFWLKPLTEDNIDFHHIDLLSSTSCLIHKKEFHTLSEPEKDRNKIFFKQYHSLSENEANIILISNNIDVLMETVIEKNTSFQLFDFCIPKINEKYPELKFTLLKDEIYHLKCVYPNDYILTEADKVVINFIQSYIENLKILAKQISN
ncbi:MAG: LysR family transcriptional regulator [Peptococcaceae bacterium]|nr:LysR family transcriptional regulator [Peptococcaceae bacterium]